MISASAPDRAKLGEGRLGRLPTPTPLGAFAEMVKRLLQASGVQTVGALDRPVLRVALACGAAGDFLGDAARCKADVFLTGEVRFHDALAAQAQSLALVLPGHHATEPPRCRAGGSAGRSAGARAGAFQPFKSGLSRRRERDPLAVVKTFHWERTKMQCRGDFSFPI